MPERMRLIAGAMSGTSADGVDVAIARVTGRGLEMKAELVHHWHRAYEPLLQQQIHRVRQAAAVDLEELAELGRWIALEYAAAVNDVLEACGLRAADLSAIAAHGQTLFHDPPLTMQWIDPALLAAETQCAVVSDFRRADCAVGGQGAPLVPFADYILFRDPTRSRVMLNLGGIANLTYLPAGGDLEQLVALDIGPGNCIGDWLCRQHHPSGPGYDVDGAMAMSGTAIDAVVETALADPYFAAPLPKSTDGPAMLGIWEQAIEKHAQRHATLSDLLATAVAVTAGAVVDAMRRYLRGPIDEIIASGGGIENDAVMRALERRCAYPVRTSDDLGVPSVAKEAISFALLGAATLDNEPANVPSCTGARRRVVLGSMTPRP